MNSISAGQLPGGYDTVISGMSADVDLWTAKDELKIREENRTVMSRLKGSKT